MLTKARLTIDVDSQNESSNSFINSVTKLSKDSVTQSFIFMQTRLNLYSYYLNVVDTAPELD